MISLEDLKKCIDYLSMLSTHCSKRDEKILLEIGVIIQREINNLEEWNKANNSTLRRQNIDADKLLADNIQLCKENQSLIESVGSMQYIVDKRIPEINYKLDLVLSKFDSLSKDIEKLGENL